MSMFFVFFSDIFAGPKILLPWQRGVTTFPLYWPPSNIDANMSVLAFLVILGSVLILRHKLPHSFFYGVFIF